MDVIRVDNRDFTVKAKQLRRSGVVPGSVFGGPLTDAVSLQIDEGAVRKLFSHKREGSKVKLELDGKIIPVQIKEKSVNTLNNEILHVSFQALAADQKVNSVIHLILKNADKITATLESQLTEIPYAAFPKDMIDTITIDVDGMPVGTVLTVGDIPELVSDKIELQVATDEIVLRIIDRKRTASNTEQESAEG